VELDLAKFRGAIPVELFGNLAFPAVGELPYFITLGPHGFYWFSLERDRGGTEEPLADFTVTGSWEKLFDPPARRQFESFLGRYIASRRWFLHKTRTITSATVLDIVSVPKDGGRGVPGLGMLVVVRVELDFGESEHYVLALSWVTGEQADELYRWRPEAVLANLTAGGVRGLLVDALYESSFVQAMVGTVTGRRGFGNSSRIVGVPTSFRRLAGPVGPDLATTPMTAEQSNSSVVVGDRAILKFIRRLDPGTNPGVELGRFLGERARFANSPKVIGHLEYQNRSTRSQGAVVAVVEEFVANEGDGWDYVIDGLDHVLEDFLATSHGEGLAEETPPRLLEVPTRQLEPGHPLVGPHLQWASLLGRHTAELHRALTTDRADPALTPVPLTLLDRQSMFHSARILLRRVLRQAGALKERSAGLEEVIGREDEIIGRLRRFVSGPLEAERIRCHGDYHLGQVLWTGKDFVSIDFEGEPIRSLGQRRLKRPASIDLAGMIRSFHYASRMAVLQVTRDLLGSVASVEPARLERWLTLWYRWVAGTFLAAYLEVAGQDGFLPAERDQLRLLLDFALMEKAIYEIGYEANTRPDWVDVPAQGILDLLAAAP
jgi:maltose alpha-D-glucosyltransferase/alpha-amylase